MNCSYNAWLQTAAMDDDALRVQYTELLHNICIFEQLPVLQVATNELVTSTHSLTGMKPIVRSELNEGACTLIGIVHSTDWTLYGISIMQLNKIEREGYLLQTVMVKDMNYCL